MELVRYTLFLLVFLVIGNYLVNNILKESFEVNIQTHGRIVDQVPDIQSANPETRSSKSQLLKGLNHDIKNFSNTGITVSGASEQLGGDRAPTSIEDPAGCNACYDLLPGSPGANQYNYGVSVDCGCKGVTGDLISGKCSGLCGSFAKGSAKCCEITTFNANELAIRDNFQKSTPEVINKRTNNWTPPHLISQLHYVGPHQPNEVEAANQNVAESTAFFTSQKTNLAQYFKANPDLYANTDKSSSFIPYVPSTSEWQEKSDCYNNMLYYTDTTAPGHFLVNKVH